MEQLGLRHDSVYCVCGVCRGVCGGVRACGGVE